MLKTFFSSIFEFKKPKKRGKIGNYAENQPNEIKRI